MKTHTFLSTVGFLFVVFPLVVAAQSIAIDPLSPATGVLGDQMNISARISGTLPAGLTYVKFWVQTATGPRTEIPTSMLGAVGGSISVRWTPSAEGTYFVGASLTTNPAIFSETHKVQISGKAITLLTKQLKVTSGVAVTVAASASSGSVSFALKRPDGLVVDRSSAVSVSLGQASIQIRPSFSGDAIVIAELSRQLVGSSGGFVTSVVSVAGDEAPPPNDTTPRFINLASRGTLETNTGTMTAGFVITGSSSQRVLVRAVGPTLGELGVPDVLANPKLAVFRGSTQIAENDDWSSDNSMTGPLNNAFSMVGAFALRSGSRDAAIMLNLSPGPYTAQVSSSIAGETGAVLLEVYSLSN